MLHDPDPPLAYGSFGHRLGALLLDGVFLVPLSLVNFFAGEGRMASVYLFLPNLLVVVFYEIYLVRQFGGTPGKLFVGLRISRLDGSEIGWREAVLRALPGLTLAVAMWVAAVVGALLMTDDEYGQRQLEALGETLAMYGMGSPILSQLAHGWGWSELIVMLTNKRRRALHDFIAGTVVVLRVPVRSRMTIIYLVSCLIVWTALWYTSAFTAML